MTSCGIGACAVALGAALAGAPASASPDGLPRLVLLLVVDQLRPEALDAALPGGLGRIVREGRRFADAALAHAGTETCPGHAAIATGRHPAAAGVPANRFLDRELGRVSECVDDPSPDAQTLGGTRGRSPRFLRADALGDWMKRAWFESRVFALSAKDRAAIALGGRRPDAVYWLDPDEVAGFTTSVYYRKDRPAWLRRFHGRDPLRDGFLAALPVRWIHPTGAPANGARPDDQPGESDLFGRTSGHPLRTGDVRMTLNHLRMSPFLDQATLALARTLVREEGLGDDAVPDLLAVSLSATDLVGHLYGPESQEARDSRVRLDGWLGEFLAELEARVGTERMLGVLASDHGVLPLPEWLAETGRGACPVPGGRVDARALAGELEAALARRFGAPDPDLWILQAGFRLAVNRRAAARRAVDPAVVASLAQRFLEQQAGVARVWTAQEIQTGEGPAPFAALYRDSHDPERSGDLVVEPERDCLLSPFSTGTSHGSPHLYDRAVPLVFWGAGVEPGVVRGRAGVVDVAPTVAAALGIAAPAGLDGRPLPLRDVP